MNVDEYTLNARAKGTSDISVLFERKALVSWRKLNFVAKLEI